MGDRINSRFIVFEGVDGAGKSTQVSLAAEALRGRGREVLVTREPGGTRLGEAVRRLLLDVKNAEMTGETEALLYAAARAQCVREVIAPALRRGTVVLCDRFADSTLAYQGYGRGLDLELLRRINDLATGGLYPALTVVLDLPVDEARLRLADGRRDRLEREAADFHERVRAGYLALAAAAPDTYLVLEADLPVPVLAERILERIEALLD
ncbi:MAG: dTMP kinase [Thermoanaerobacterales bacterium]|nr:dTMP kinase [Bacillota bacterium]MDI6906984.1 dTMP kinase [Thermoanaerobacterales bacterium]